MFNNLARTLVTLCLLTASATAVLAQKEPAKQEDDTGLILRQIGWLAKDPALRAELEISDEQVKSLQQMASDMRRDYKAVWQGRSEEMKEIGRMKEEGDIEGATRRWEAIQAEIREVSKQKMRDVGEALLPHQVDRIKQIALQQRVKRQNPYGDEFGAPLALADRLNLTDEQKKKLKEAVEKARASFYKQMLELKKTATDEIMDSLPKAKQEELRQLMGETYDSDKARREYRAKWDGAKKGRENVNKLKSESKEAAEKQ